MTATPSSFFRRRGLALVLALALAPAAVFGETPEELRLLFEDLLAAARGGDAETVAAVAKDLAIPRTEDWCRRLWGDDLGPRIADVQTKWIPRLRAQLDGTLQPWLQTPDVRVETVRIDDPSDARIPAELRKTVAAMRQRTPIFLVQFQATGKAAGRAPGAFVFLDQGFRWFGETPLDGPGDPADPPVPGGGAPGTGPADPAGTGTRPPAGGAPGGGVAAIPPAAVPDTEAALEGFLRELLAAAQAQDGARVAGGCESLSRWEHEPWLRSAFGDERGASAARWYGLRIRDAIPEALPNVLAECARQGITEVRTWTVDRLGHPEAREAEREALLYQRSPLRLYGARLLSPDGNASVALRSIIHANGHFRFVGDFPGLRPAGKIVDWKPTAAVEEVRILLLLGDTFPAAATHLVGQRLPSEAEMRRARERTFQHQSGDPLKPFERIRTGDVLDFASLTIVNPGDHPIRSVRVEAVVPGFSEPAVTTFSLEAGERRRVGLTPLFGEKVFEGEADRPAALRLKVEFDGTVVFEKTYPFNLLHRKICVWTDPEYGELSEIIAVWVNPHDEIVRILVSQAAEFLPGRAIGGPAPVLKDERDVETLQQVENTITAVMAVLHRWGLHYVSTSFAIGPTQQQIEFPAECVAHRAANCIEGAALMAAAFEALKLNVSIAIIPGHAVVVVVVPIADTGKSLMIPVETTVVGSPVMADTPAGRMPLWKFANERPDKPQEGLYARLAEHRSRGEYTDIPVALLHRLGIRPAPVKFPVPDWVTSTAGGGTPGVPSTGGTGSGRRPGPRQQPPTQEEPKRPDPAALTEIGARMAQEAGWPPSPEADNRIEPFRRNLANAFSQTLYAIHTSPWSGWRQEVLQGFFAIQREAEKLVRYTEHLRPWVNRRQQERQMVARLEAIHRSASAIWDKLKGSAIERGYPAQELDRDLGVR